MAQVLLLLLIAMLTPEQLLTDTPVQVRITDSCAQLRPRETLLDLEPDSPLVLTHRIRLLPGPGAACAQCGGELTGLQERMEQLERQVSELRERCGGAEGCCGSQQSRGSVCSTVRPSTDACPDGCSDQGRCVEGRCVCFAGFRGPDCSVPDCPDDCNNRGRCVDGRCVCDSGFTGPDCSESSCPGDCSNRGRCVDGRCVCESGFTGPDCSVKACPDNCSNRGRCVDGQCVCESGFSGPDCSSKSCPNSCSNRGRCVRGRCVCRRGFTGPDCSQCQPGFSGENCDTPLTGVMRLSTRDISESSVTVFWTPPPLLYDTYHISFSSSKETEQKISSRISGRLSSYTQTGLAAGQEYTVTVTGEKDGVMGAESSAQFTTLISGPKNLRVVKTSTTSIVVQWEKAQGEIDRYVLSVAPNQTDRSSGPREMVLPPERDSAQIDSLHAGRLYEVSVVAERGSTRSLPARAQATPGPVTADQQPDTSTSPVPQRVRHAGDQPTGSRPTWRNTVQSSLPGSRTPARPKLSGSSFPASAERPRLRMPSSSSSASSSAEMDTTGTKDSPTLAARFRMSNRSELMPHQRAPYRRLRRPPISALQNRTKAALDLNQTHRPPLDPAQTHRPALGPAKARTLTLDPAQIHRPAPPSRPMIRPRLRVPSPSGHTGSSVKNTLQLHSGPNRDSGASADTDQRMENHINMQNYKLSGSKQHVEVSNRTSAGSEREWTTAKEQFRPFTITQPQLEDRDDDEDDEDDDDGLETAAGRGSGNSSGNSAVFGSAGPHTQMTAAPPASGHSHSLSTSGKEPAFHSTTHNLILHAGPEPPSALLFSDVTDSSFTVSWKKPKSKVSGFKITHTHVQEGEPVSVSVDSETLRLDLSSRAPGSTYEVRVVSVLGQDESDPITDTVNTLPDAPTHLQAINVTDSKALLIWRPALATVDHYRIIYSPEAAPDSPVSISVSGNAAQHHLQSLHSSTRYTVSISSQRGEQSSSSSTTAFSTTSGAGRAEDGPRDLKATQVTPRSAVLSWRPPESPISGYRLSYFTDQEDKKELVLDAGVSELHLRRLVPSSVYTAQLQAERAGLHTHTVHTHFTTGSLRFPFPTDCSQERQNGALESGPVEVFPQGRSGRPLRVYCDMETDGGGWTVFQRRKDGKTNFFRRWREYSSGFGTLDGEFWMGNELLHNFTQSVPMELRVDLRAGAESAFALYSSFTIDTAKRHYTLRIAGYSGTAGDSLSYHSGRPFSTRDRDPRPFITRCAMSYRGGWWYKNCHEANLNGLYNTSSNHQGVIWTAWKGQDFSIPFTEMKFRPASFQP